MAEEKDWTIMVYLAGDNNLSENMAYSLEEIQSVSGGASPDEHSKVNLLAFFDSSSLTAPTHYFDFSDGKKVRHKIEKSDALYSSDKKRINATDDGNSASAYSILNFVNWCIRTQGRTARNYALIFSGHSFGFHGTSFLRDESSGSFITLFKFRWALEEINKEFLKAGRKISILGFDSCVMSMLEVGVELKDVAETMIASEGSLPNAGWGYAPILKRFVTNFGCELENKDKKGFLDWVATPDYVKMAAKGFVESYTEQQKQLSIGGRSIDISAWDLNQVEPVARNVNRLAVELNRHLDLTEKIHKDKLTDQEIEAYQELKKILLQSHYDSQTYMKEQCVDLRDFCQRLIIECKFMEKKGRHPVFSPLKLICRDIILSVNRCILKCGYSGDEYQFSNGISLYFPWSHITYFLTDQKYRYLHFIRGVKNKDVEHPSGLGKDWNAFLFNYLTRVTMRITRKDADGGISLMDNFTKDNPIWTRDNPIWTRDNPRWTRDNPPWTRDNPIWTRDNPPWTRDNPRWTKDNPIWTRGEVGEYLFYFSRFKNFQLRWDIAGYAEESEFDEDFE